MDDLQDMDGVSLLEPSTKKAKLEFDLSKCVICFKHKRDDKLVNGTDQGVDTLLKVAHNQKDTVFNRLPPDVVLSHKADVKYHRSCYKSYTSMTNIKHRGIDNASSSTADPIKELNEVQDTRTLRSDVSPFDWGSCLVCSNKRLSKDPDKVQIGEKGVESIKLAAAALNDSVMQVRLANVDLIAVGACYHKKNDSVYTLEVLKSLKMLQRNQFLNAVTMM